MKFDTKKLNNLQNIEVDLPVLKKFLLCLPLRPGLIIWGYLQVMATTALSLSAIQQFADKAAHMDNYVLVQAVIIFMITMIASLLDIISCLFLVLGAQRKNANFLEVCYHYLKVKVPVYFGLLIISFILKSFVQCRSWYYYNLDDWRFFVLLDYQAVGVIDVALQFYLLLLVRSEIIKLEQPIDWSLLYERFQSKPAQADVSADSLTEKPSMDA